MAIDLSIIVVILVAQIIVIPLLRRLQAPVRPGARGDPEGWVELLSMDSGQPPNSRSSRPSGPSSSVSA